MVDVRAGLARDRSACAGRGGLGRCVASSSPATPDAAIALKDAKDESRHRALPPTPTAVAESRVVLAFQRRRKKLTSVLRRARSRDCRSRPSALAAGCLLGGWLLGAASRRLSVRTGVSDAEAYGSVPGDDIIPHPMVEWTRGVTVQTTAERVWPWLAQMGYGRGGWYTPEWVDLFANRWVFGVRAPFPKSANRLVPGAPARRGRGPDLRRS